MRKSISLIIGLLALIIGLLIVYIRVSVIKAGFVTKATVIQIESKDDGDETLFRPVLQFTDHRNKLMHYRPEYRATDWQLGETVKVLYSNSNYNDISLLSYWGYIMIGIAFISVGMVSLLNAGGDYWTKRFLKTIIYPNP